MVFFKKKETYIYVVCLTYTCKYIASFDPLRCKYLCFCNVEFATIMLNFFLSFMYLKIRKCSITVFFSKISIIKLKYCFQFREQVLVTFKWYKNI